MPRLDRAAPLHALAAFVCAAYAVWFLAAIRTGIWPVLPDGRLVNIDFVPLHAAGRLALGGAAAAAYDWQVLAAVPAAVTGPFGGWLYPPTFFLLMSPLAALPYLPALVVFMGGSGALFALAMRAILQRPGTALIGFAAPATVACIHLGQGGFLFAGLMGFAFLLLDRRPLLAGLCLGLLTVKPHLGLLFPLLLALDRRWRTIAAATATALLLAGASAALFGMDAWEGFLGSIGGNARRYLGEPESVQATLQSVYGVVRRLTGSPALGAALHLPAALAAAGVAIRLWARRTASPDRKAAAAIAAALLVTPYVFPYDAVVLTVALGFLARAWRETGRSRTELALLVLAALLPGLCLVIRFGLFVPAAAALVLGLAAWRAGALPRPARPGGDPAPAGGPPAGG